MTENEIIYNLIKINQPIPTFVIRQKASVMLSGSVSKCICDLHDARKIKYTQAGWITI